MMNPRENTAACEKFSEKVLTSVRNVVRAWDLDGSRLPGWIHQAEITSCAQAPASVVFLIRESNNGDEYSFDAKKKGDTELFFRSKLSYDGSLSTSYQIPSWDREKGGSILLGGKTLGEEDSSDYWIYPDQLFLAAKSYDYHPPFLLHNVFVHVGEGEKKPRKTAFVPAAMYVHRSDFDRVEHLVETCVETICQHLKDVHDSEIGDHFESESGRVGAFETSLENSVIVLGDYDDGPHENELRQVRDQIRSRGYNAYLIKELPGNPSKPLPHKVKMWCLGSKFSVLVDRDPSGHVREYSDLVGEDVPIAILREQNSGSTFMIGHERHTDDFVEQFEFEQTSLEVVDDAITWAEEFSSKLEEIYDSEYPWRG